jgi:hypothetical protein
MGRDTALAEENEASIEPWQLLPALTGGRTVTAGLTDVLTCHNRRLDHEVAGGPDRTCTVGCRLDLPL